MKKPEVVAVFQNSSKQQFFIHGGCFAKEILKDYGDEIVK
jgi:hypothetical protein